MTVAQGDRRRVTQAEPIAPLVERWFERSARDLPWRRKRSPYGTLVSEAMLQQTQVARVAPAWESFMAHFPTIRALERASEESVVEAWRGLGYYRRARQLHRAARVICDLHHARVPSKREELIALPGIGPYCAGAISSIAFGEREPIVDGNVARVLMRVHGRSVDRESPLGSRWVWQRAREYVDGSRLPGNANEGLMELGATLCAPRNPRCDECPLAKRCVAHETGAESRIPAPRKRAARTLLHADVIIARIDGRTALVRRADAGLWGGMLFPPSHESQKRVPKQVVAATLGLESTEMLTGAAFTFLTTHREVRFRVWCASERASRMLKKSQGSKWTWHATAAVARASLSSAMRKVFESIGERPQPNPARVRVRLKSK